MNTEDSRPAYEGFEEWWRSLRIGELKYCSHKEIAKHGWDANVKTMSKLEEFANGATHLLTEGHFRNADNHDVPIEESVKWCFDWAKAMLAESVKRHSEIDGSGDR